MQNHIFLLDLIRLFSFIDPKLTEHVATKLKDEAAIAKERRKAREEKKLKAEKG